MFHWLARFSGARRASAALPPEPPRACPLCDDTAPLPARGAHTARCGTCGYDDTWEHDPTRADTIALFRDLTLARDALRLGCETLRDHTLERAEQLALADHHELVAHEHLARVRDLDPVLIDDVFGQNFATQLQRVEQARCVVRRMLSPAATPPSSPRPA
ncbi:MAG: hypothetical protein KTR31_17940 [Myxococcales bacterium]|nr:hypothetical protein [Myxococcales bacterium]